MSCCIPKKPGRSHVTAKSEVCSSDEELEAPPGTLKQELKFEENFLTAAPL